MNDAFDRRLFLQGAVSLPALMALGLPAAAFADEGALSFGPVKPFSFGALVERARKSASEAYVPPEKPSPDITSKLTYEELGKIKFKTEDALWANGPAPFPVTFFHLGTFFQKRFGGSLDARAGTALQYAGACVLLLPFAIVTEHGRLDPILPVAFGLAWSVFGMSIGAILMLLHMIRKGAVAAVSSLFFLVPALSSLMAYLAFGETLSAIQLCGLALAVLGVSAASRG